MRIFGVRAGELGSHLHLRDPFPVSSISDVSRARWRDPRGWHHAAAATRRAGKFLTGSAAGWPAAATLTVGPGGPAGGDPNGYEAEQRGDWIGS
jgi:hypothetical protein